MRAMEFSPTIPPAQIASLTRCAGCRRWTLNPHAHLGCVATPMLVAQPPRFQTRVKRGPKRKVEKSKRRGNNLHVELECGHVAHRWRRMFKRRPRWLFCEACA